MRQFYHHDCLCAEGLLTAQWPRIFLLKPHCAEGLFTAQWVNLLCHCAEGFLKVRWFYFYLFVTMTRQFYHHDDSYHCAEGLLTAQWLRILIFKLHCAEGLLTAQWEILIFLCADGFLTAQWLYFCLFFIVTIPSLQWFISLCWGLTHSTMINNIFIWTS